MSSMTRSDGSPVYRWAFVGAILCLALAPVLQPAAMTVGQLSDHPLWTDSFQKSMRSTLTIGAGVACMSLLIGLPFGLLAALYRFPGRKVLILFQALPLLLPSFLLSIGWSNLSGGMNSSWLSWLPWDSGTINVTRCVFVLGLQAIPLPFFATWAACQNITASQIDAVRLHGGERSVLHLTARACAPVAILAAMIGGIISLSDTGAPLIFGCRSAAVEILTSFSALFDYGLAGRQCLALAGFALLLTAPVLMAGLPILASAILARQTRPFIPVRPVAFQWAIPTGLLAILAVGIALPTLGLCLPAVQNPMIARAWQKVSDTSFATMFFTGGAGLVAVVLATCLALAAKDNARTRMTILAVLLALLAVPPSMAAIGLSRMATLAPPQFDWLLRSQLTVPIMLGLRFLPVATIVMMRATGSLSPSWTEAARLHGVSVVRQLTRIALPNLRSSLIASLLLVAFLAAADITTTHLLQPPGWQTLPVAIFTVMANSPEGLVASLCLFYLSAVVLLLLLSALLPAVRLRRTS